MVERMRVVRARGRARMRRRPPRETRLCSRLIGLATSERDVTTESDKSPIRYSLNKGYQTKVQEC